MSRQDAKREAIGFLTVNSGEPTINKLADFWTKAQIAALKWAALIAKRPEEVIIKRRIAEMEKHL